MYHGTRALTFDDVSDLVVEGGSWMFTTTAFHHKGAGHIRLVYEGGVNQSFGLVRFLKSTGDFRRWKHLNVKASIG